MKYFIAALVASAGIATIGNVAEAAGFTLDSYSVDLNDTDPGLVVNWAPILGSPTAFDLAVGESFYTGLFSIWTDETTVNAGEDQAPKPISVNFNFSLPDAFGGSVTGNTGGYRVFGGLFQGGAVEWDGPSVFSFGNGGQLAVSLFDATFNQGFLGLKEGEKYGATVKAKFTLISDSIPEPEDVPEPMALLGLGLVGTSLMARKRSRQSAA